MGRCIGLDVHRDFAQVAVWENGRVRDAGRVATSPERLREFAQTLRPSDRVALEATMNTAAIAGLIGERAGEVVVSNPFKTSGPRPSPPGTHLHRRREDPVIPT